MAKMVGLSRGLKSEWLDKTVKLVLAGLSENEIKDELNEYLSFEIKSPTNIRKTREILMNLWVYPNEDMDDIRNDAIIAFKTGKGSSTFGTDPIATAIVVVIWHFSHQRIKCKSTSFWVHRDNLQSEQNKNRPLIVLLCAVQ